MSNDQLNVIPTTAGSALITGALKGGNTINLSHFQLGSSAEEVRAGQTALNAPETEKLPITSINDVVNTEGEIDTGVIEVQCNIPPDVGGFSIYECGIYTDAGVLFAVFNLTLGHKPLASQGQTVDLELKVRINVGTVETVNMVVDPNLIIATQEWVNNNSIPAKHIEDTDNPHETHLEAVIKQTIGNKGDPSQVLGQYIDITQTGAVKAQSVYYVDQINGDDGNDGLSAEYPLASINHAVWSGRNSFKIKVYLLENYTIDRVIGSSSSKIVIAGYESVKTIQSGGVSTTLWNDAKVAAGFRDIPDLSFSNLNVQIPKQNLVNDLSAQRAFIVLGKAINLQFSYSSITGDGAENGNSLLWCPNLISWWNYKSTVQNAAGKLVYGETAGTPCDSVRRLFANGFSSL